MAPPNALLQDCRALVIDDNPTSRSIVASQLRDLGVGSVVQSPRVQDARRVLEHQRFDIVLSEQRFHGSSYSGQDLIDDLRRANLLPLDTVFIMLTNEASYAKVAEAAESALDGYLLKPHTAAALGERLAQSRQRKRELADIFAALDRGDLAGAAALCRQRFEARASYWLYAARIGAELMLRAGDAPAARELFEAVLAAKAVPWSRLGIARAQLDMGQAQPARRTLEALLGSEPGYADAWDVLGQTQLEQGGFAEALQTFRRAAELTPGSIDRLQKAGMLAFWTGAHDEATRLLERAVLIGAQSKQLDAQVLVLLGLLRFDRKDGKGLQRCIDNLSHVREREAAQRGEQAEPPRLVRMAAVLQVLMTLYERRSADALARVRAVAEDAESPDFDPEAAGNWLALLARLATNEIQLDTADAWVERTALRFCTAKAVADMLALSAAGHAPYEQAVRSAAAHITAQAEQAVSHTLAGRPTEAVRHLLAEAGRTGNGKLIELARLTLERHRAHLPSAAADQAQVEALRQRFPAAGALLGLARGARRTSGGLALRGAALQRPGEAAPAASAASAAPAAPAAPTAQAVQPA